MQRAHMNKDALLQAWWDLALDHVASAGNSVSKTTVGKLSYLAVFTKVHKSLVSEWSASAAEQAVLADWQADSTPGEPVLTEAAFKAALDNLARTTSPHAHDAFLRHLLECVTQPDQTSLWRRSFRHIRDVVPGSALQVPPEEHDSEAVDIPDVLRAAIKVQAGARGRACRQQTRQMKEDLGVSPSRKRRANPPRFSPADRLLLAAQAKAHHEEVASSPSIYDLEDGRWATESRGQPRSCRPRPKPPSLKLRPLSKSVEASSSQSLHGIGYNGGDDRGSPGRRPVLPPRSLVEDPLRSVPGIAFNMQSGNSQQWRVSTANNSTRRALSPAAYAHQSALAAASPLAARALTRAASHPSALPTRTHLLAPLASKIFGPTSPDARPTLVSAKPVWERAQSRPPRQPSPARQHETPSPLRQHQRHQHQHQQHLFDWRLTWSDDGRVGRAKGGLPSRGSDLRPWHEPWTGGLSAIATPRSELTELQLVGNGFGGGWSKPMTRDGQAADL